MEIREALEQLQVQGHRVDYKPVFDGDRLFYHVDEIPLTEYQVLKWAVDGVRPGDIPRPLSS